MRGAHPRRFQPGKIIPVSTLAHRLHTTPDDVRRRVEEINRVYLDDMRFRAAWPVVRCIDGAVVYDRRFFNTVWAEVVTPLR